MTEPFKPGDVVYLKSGGPKMTVKEFDQKVNEVICEWFNENDLKERGFHPDTLKMYTTPPPLFGPIGGRNRY